MDGINVPKKWWALLAVLAIALCASIGLTFLQPQGPISEERAITIIKAHVAEADNYPHEDIRIDEIELRPPTKSESDLLLERGEEPPELVWFARITIFRFPSWMGHVREGYAGIICPILISRTTTFCLDAYTGEVVLGSLLDG